MVQAHRMICPVRGKRLQIDLPSDFPEGAEVEVIILPLPTATHIEEDQRSAEWLRNLWGCSPNFPDRLPDPAPEPVEIP